MGSKPVPSAKASDTRGKAPVSSAQSSTIPWTSDKVKFIWLKKRRPLYRKVSFNVTREICSYFSHIYGLVIVRRDRMDLIDILSSTTREVELHSYIEVTYNSASTFIGTNEIFVCGGWAGEVSNNERGKYAYILSFDGQVRKMPYMLTGRETHGMVYDKTASSVYVFGGMVLNLRGRQTRTASSERLVLKSAEWRNLPDMKEPRAVFNPCILASVVYICGGGPRSIETYSIQSDEFTLLPFQRFPDEVTGFLSCICVEHFNALILITESYITKCDLNWSGVTACQVQNSYTAWSACTAVVYDGALYMTRGTRWRCIDLESGEERKNVSVG